MASKLQLPADDSVTLIVSHSNLTSFSSDVRVSQQVPPEPVIRLDLIAEACR
jgi:tubulin-folding cofactor B